MAVDIDPEIAAMIETAYTAFNQRDVDRVLAVMAEDVEWSNGWEGGFVHGHDGVRDYWRRQWQELDPTVVPVSIARRDDGRIDVRVDQVIRRTDGEQISAGHVNHVYTLRNGLIARMDIEKAA